MTLVVLPSAFFGPCILLSQYAQLSIAKVADAALDGYGSVARKPDDLPVGVDNFSNGAKLYRIDGPKVGGICGTNLVVGLLNYRYLAPVVDQIMPTTR